MSTVLELVYQYRHLVGKSETGAGLDVDEIDALHTIKALFAGDHPDLDVWRGTRQFARASLVRATAATAPAHSDGVWGQALLAQLRSRGNQDQVEILEVAPGGMVVGAAPYLAPGTTIELVYDDLELALSYRFKALVVWRADDDQDDYLLGLELVGTPIRLRRKPADSVATTAAETEAARVAA